MAEYGSIYIEKGPGGYSGPLVVTPTDQRNKVMYILGEMDKPPCLDRIVELSGMIPVDSYKETVPEDEIALAIVDDTSEAREDAARFAQKHSAAGLAPVPELRLGENLLADSLYAVLDPRIRREA